MTELDVVWLAGYLEGEGCFRAPKPHNKTVGIDVASTDKDIIEKVARLMNASFSIVAPKNVKWKVQYRITLTGERAVVIMEKILPYMGARRSGKIEEVLSYWGSKPFSRRGKKWADPETKEVFHFRKYEGKILLKELGLD